MAAGCVFLVFIVAVVVSILAGAQAGQQTLCLLGDRVDTRAVDLDAAVEGAAGLLEVDRVSIPQER